MKVESLGFDGQAGMGMCLELRLSSYPSLPSQLGLKQMVLRPCSVLPSRSSRRVSRNGRHAALFRRAKHLLERFNGRVAMGRLPLALYPFANPLETLVANSD